MGDAHRSAPRVNVRVHFAGDVHAWLRLQVERYWSTHRRRLRDPLWDLEYLDVFLRLP